MLKRFEVENYRNFKNRLVLDFSDVAGYKFNEDCITEGCLGKLIIYGRNATGKSNLCDAIEDVRSMRMSFRSRPDDVFFLNADSEEKTAFFKYCFQFGENEVVYSYRKASEYQYTWERLEVNGETAFDFDVENAAFNALDLSLIDANEMNTEVYLEGLMPSEDDEREPMPSFLFWLMNAGVFPPGSVMRKLGTAISGITVVDQSREPYYSRLMSSRIYSILKDKAVLKDFEQFLNEMGIQCELEIERLPDDSYQLYFVHDRRRIPFANTASSGTLSLMRLYSRFIARTIRKPSIIIMDEFDAFYHYEMAENVVRYFKKNMPQTQVIFTTHNTNLMSNHLMRPDCLLILSSDGRITPLMRATSRELREGHNLEKMYIGGEFADYE